MAPRNGGGNDAGDAKPPPDPAPAANTQPRTTPRRYGNIATDRRTSRQR